MTIKPFDLQEPDIPQEFKTLLEDSGLQEPPEKILKGKENIDNARNAFNIQGAGVKEAARTIADIMSTGSTDVGKLRASELVLKVHGILNEMDEKQTTSITINIGSIVNNQNNIAVENRTLVNLVCPT